MKMMFDVIAMAIISPALAQAAPTADAHAGHSAPAGTATPAPHTGHANPASGREGHDMTGDCCEKAPAETPAADPHAGHNMSQR